MTVMHSHWFDVMCSSSSVPFHQTPSSRSFQLLWPRAWAVTLGSLLEFLLSSLVRPYDRGSQVISMALEYSSRYLFILIIRVFHADSTDPKQTAEVRESIPGLASQKRKPPGRDWDAGRWRIEEDSLSKICIVPGVNRVGCVPVTW